MHRFLTIALACLTLAACDPGTSRLQRMARDAANPAVGRAGATTAIVAAFNKKQVKLSDAMDLAFRLVEQARASADPNGSPGTTAFAGAVLDASAALNDQLPKAPEMELFYIRLGRLAFTAADEAAARGRMQEARTLVLAGTKRWQSEPYWMQYPDHDGLASAIMAACGQTEDAIKRLQLRSDLNGPAAEVYDQLIGRHR